jgi:hypothetical protein
MEYNDFKSILSLRQETYDYAPAASVILLMGENYMIKML